MFLTRDINERSPSAPSDTLRRNSKLMEKTFISANKPTTCAKYKYTRLCIHYKK